ncbi:MAG: PfkB family carbohydrate kinase [SAR86 cluster bacterium]|nr:PfkB family carbohydrate kinase [SAR86 cluster bacterium]
MKKIISLKSLTDIIDGLNSKNQSIAHCHGVFDLLHIGHIRHFKEAKEFGDILIVSLTPDIYVNKGSNRPAFTAELRAEAIASLEFVDYVVINDKPTAIEIIEVIKPKAYIKGPDYKDNSKDITGKIKDEVEAVESNGGKIIYTSDITFSSSNLLNKFGNVFSETQKSFVSKISKQHSFDNISKKIEELSKLKVLVVGETIVDQYVFCEALGKSGKEPVLALRNINTEQYVGGTAAIANHLSGFCKEVSLLSMLGENKEHEDFISEGLASNIFPSFIYKNDSPTIVKRRYLDNVSKSKTLGVYSINDDPLERNNEKEFQDKLTKLIPLHDLVIVADYGHGLISKNSSSLMSGSANFLSLNAQINASNIGFHTMDNYTDVDCIIINESELRYELRDRNGNIESIMKKLADNLKAKYIVVTQGSTGAVIYNTGSEIYSRSPAFASNIVDKIGSGDAMLAILSLLLKQDCDMELALFLASLAAAQSVETIGNSKSVNKNEILKVIQHAII